MRNVILVFLAIIWFPSLSSSQEIAKRYEYLGPFGDDIVVATVTRVFDEKATEARPFRLRLKIEEVLRGAAMPRYALATWPLTPNEFAGTLPPETPPIHAKPKVDIKLILWCKTQLNGTHSTPILRISAFHRHTDTPEHRTWTAKIIREAERRRVEAEQKEQRHWETVLNDWQANFTATKINKLTEQADVVVIAKDAGAEIFPNKPSQFTFLVSRVLKGNLRQSFDRDKTRLRVSTEGNLTQLLRRQGRQLPEFKWILFLTDKGLVGSREIGGPDHYQMLDNNTAIMAVDPSYIEAISNALGK